MQKFSLTFFSNWELLKVAGGFMINRQQQSFMLFFIFCIFSSSPSWADNLTAPLDGMTFVGNNGEIGHELDPDEYEEISFQDGLFTSVSCLPYNFSGRKYSTKSVNNIIHFEAVTESPTHGKIVWQGSVDGNTAEATFIWTKERWYWNTRKEYWFKGSLKE